MKLIRLTAIAAVTLILSGCTIKTPEVSFTSERTALEKQILGSYRTIEEDAWMITSVRSSDETDVVIPESKKKALLAFADRKYNADDVADFKQEGSVGENTAGKLTIRPTEKYNQDPQYRSLVDRVVADENNDRRIIMGRVVEINMAVNPLDSTEVQRVFAQMNQESSPSGTWIQQADGQWVKK
ncbi:MAG: DUF1318 domain-containing protein [bacterium]|nr:DUF1318 domain-containing protein [bacterium]